MCDEFHTHGGELHLRPDGLDDAVGHSMFTDVHRLQRDDRVARRTTTCSISASLLSC